MSTHQKLVQSLEKLQTSILHYSTQKDKAQVQTSEMLEELQTTMTDNVLQTMQNIENSKQSLSFTVTIVCLGSKDLVDLPTLEFQIKYQTLKLTGTERQLRTNQEIQQKFVLPVLHGSQDLSIILYKPGQQTGEVFDEVSTNLSQIFAPEGTSVEHMQTRLAKNHDVWLKYSIAIQGFGLESWRKNSLAESVTAKQHEKLAVKQGSSASSLKSSAQKESMDKLFCNRALVIKEAKMPSFDTHIEGIDEILSLLTTQL